ncbi:MAG: ArnT family glycosyltransferase [Planctomycetota bacterium]|jgi:hypothetical protein
MSEKSSGTYTSQIRILEWIVLGLLLVVAIGFRAFLNNSGFPEEIFERRDELHYVRRAVGILNGQWEVEYFINPSLYMYVLYGTTVVCGWALTMAGQFESFAEFTLEAALNPYMVTMVGRYISLCLSASSVILLYFLGRRMFSVRTGIIAAATFAVNLTSLQSAVLAGNESMMVFLVLLLFLLLLCYRKVPSLRCHLACGALLGFAISTKYNAAVHGLPFLVVSAVCYFRDRASFSWRFPPLRYWLGFLVVPFAFAVGSPFALINLSDFVAGFSKQASFLHSGYTDSDVASGYTGWLYYIEGFPGRNNGTVFALICAAGIVYFGYRMIRHRDVNAMLLLLAILPAYLVLGSGIFSKMRFLLPAIPFILLAGSRMLDLMVGCVARWFSYYIRHSDLQDAIATVGILAIAALILATQGNTAYDIMRRDFGETDPRNELVMWIRENMDTDQVYLELALPAHLGLLGERYVISRYGLSDVALGTEAERRRFRAFDKRAYRSRDFRDLLSQSLTLEDLLKRIRVGGYRHVLVILHTSIFLRIYERPHFANESVIRDCPYWKELIDYLFHQPRNPQVFSRNQLLMMCLISLDS